MFPIAQIEARVEEKLKEPLSIAHDFDHLYRTAIGAKWFAKLLGAGNAEQEKAYLSGLLHDIYRPPESTTHEESLPENCRQAKAVLQEFSLEQETIEEIVLPIKRHRELPQEKDLLCQSVFLADKILENMGAMIVFRRNMYIGENPRYVGVPLRDALIAQYEKRLNKFKPSDFPTRFSCLAEYQYRWPNDYLDSFKKGGGWAIEIVSYFYEKGKQKNRFVKTVFGFKPKHEKGCLYKKEAIEYVKGEKFKFFESLVR